MIRRRITTSASISIILFLNFLIGCGQAGDQRQTLFTSLPPPESGIEFANSLTDTEEFNVFTYRNYFNGGGVGIGDVNGDGLADVYLTANQLPNRLFLNLGRMRFRDVTEQAGVKGIGAWSTGVSLADVNGDGLLDIYICNAGNIEGDDKANELYINQGPGPDGVPRFVERAREFGIADEGYSTHAAFFDYDLDGDLDVYILNNSFRPAGSFGLRNIRHIRDEKGGDKLYRNDDGSFVDVSVEAGIYGSEIGFGLGVTVGDVNADGWLDIYVSNDFFERDYLYVNSGDGTFRESLVDRMRHISLSSMGADMADINNDGFPEIYVTDMLPEDDRRLKTTTIYRSWDVYQAQLRNDYSHQYMRNMLHLNDGGERFAEIGQISGVSTTDWSWGALFADFDLDGFKDIFVSNGIYKDLTNQDFIDFLASDATLQMWIEAKDRSYLKLLAEIPSQPLRNYAFRNLGDLRFENAAAEWGLDTPSFSNGAAYGDLDNDGDLDLVVNNVNMPAFVYRNDADKIAPANYLQFVLNGRGMNRFAVGANVRVYVDGKTLFVEQVPQRGFQSSVDPVLTIGLGSATKVDSAVVRWPDGAVMVLTGIELNQRIVLNQTAAGPGRRSSSVDRAKTVLQDVTRAVALPYRHSENEFVDFDRESLLLRMVSTEGPRIAAGDVNGDGRIDLFLGGAKDRPGTLLRQRSNGNFESVQQSLFDADRTSEDIGVAFFDADDDNDLDLYVVSGGSEYDTNEPALQDRLYLNQGGGRFLKSNGLPAMRESGSVVAAADYDGDGDQDLFVGARLVPGQYGFEPHSAILRNEGGGRFANVTNFTASDLERAGLVTDAVWTDYDGDGHTDLIVVGEWMPITVFRNTGDGRLSNATERSGLARSHGLWNRIVADDLDADGDVDLVAGNLGLNTKLRAWNDRPMTMYVSDFDRNGSVEQVLFYYTGDKSYPIALRSQLVRQLNFLKKKYVNYADFAEQTATDIFSPDLLATAEKREVYILETSVLENAGDGTFVRRALPYEAQLSPVYGIVSEDLDQDGIRDLLLAGNFFAVQPSVGRMDANHGVFLKGKGVLEYEAVSSSRSGFAVDGEVRDMTVIQHPNHGRLIVAARNNDSVQLFRVGS